jgi:hypothetical protein
VLLLWDTLVDRAAVPADHSVVVTNLAYPVLDVMLLPVPAPSSRTSPATTARRRSSSPRWRWPGRWASG